jgi:NitT/TauT family transport system substrate-binding protein
VVKVRIRLARCGAALVLFATVACGGGAEAETSSLRLGYFPTITHAPAIVAVEEGLFTAALGSEATLQPVTFNAGPGAIEALFSDAADAVYLGPNPAINAFAQSEGAALRIIAGSTSGGAFLVVRPDLATAESLRGATIATPQLGNTQDVAARAWLAEQGLMTNLSGGGDVSLVPQENAQTLETFQQGEVDGAWVPEPWATRLIQEAGGTVLVDERDLWPDGRYVTTHLVVRAAFLEENPQLVELLLEGHLQALDLVNDAPVKAQEITNDGIEAITGKRLGPEVISTAWESLVFTEDPIASSLAEGARRAEAVDLLDPVDLDGIYALEPLNRLLESMGRPTVEGLS